jgi:hypothetical protein
MFSNGCHPASCLTSIGFRLCDFEMAEDEPSTLVTCFFCYEYGNVCKWHLTFTIECWIFKRCLVWNFWWTVLRSNWHSKIIQVLRCQKINHWYQDRYQVSWILHDSTTWMSNCKKCFLYFAINLEDLLTNPHVWGAELFSNNFI